MKTGDLVECVSGFEFMQMMLNCEIPNLKKVYTVREYREDDEGDGLLLEEIVNSPRKFKDGMKEPAFCITAFRAFKVPESISVEDILEGKI